MRFVDECTLRAEAGDGGRGCVAFRREKFQPFGGPSGGDGGRGGDVVLVADPGRNTLLELHHLRTVRAERGEHGLGKDMYGRAGAPAVVRVPLGTIVYDDDSRAVLGELVRPDDELVVARGGRGGRGNLHFATPTDRAPRRADPGEAGERRTLRLELRVMADVGLLGFPNVGKSTFVSAVSRARPRIADYPFTTLEPHLGVVAVGDTRRGLARTFVIADIPGLIPGASEGAGLGARFLRHLERTRALLHLVTVSDEPGREPVADYQALRLELARFDPGLARRPEVVALSQADLPHVRAAYPDLRARFAELGVQLRLVSAATHEGLDDLVQELAEHVM
ncbi:MAG: GTPase ObgE [Polyangiaceae bacterium]|nr:GTPase ObgE [Polyangiaceae bacterium]